MKAEGATQIYDNVIYCKYLIKFYRGVIILLAFIFRCFNQNILWRYMN